MKKLSRNEMKNVKGGKFGAGDSSRIQCGTRYGGPAACGPNYCLIDPLATQSSVCINGACFTVFC
jgi:hypothetical protein